MTARFVAFRSARLSGDGLYQERIFLRTCLKEKLRDIGEPLKAVPSGRLLSLSDPDVRSMATSGRASCVVGYNVTIAVGSKCRIIVGHEVTDVGHDRTVLNMMSVQAPDTQMLSLSFLTPGRLDPSSLNGRLRRWLCHDRTFVDKA
jgi:hypothetical protein